jgi:16S rRNA (adenine1518-N6/adenine1519-N6)-dimethyltransferase
MKHEAKKRFGQNFLKDQVVLDKIVQAMPRSNHPIVEIGPGLGDLTSRLLLVNSVKAYEVDYDLCPVLSGKFSDEMSAGKFSLICGDVLEVWSKNQTLHESKYDLIANLPYYIATTIILDALDDDNCQNIVAMVQLEVAKKFCATTNEREFSALSVISEICGGASLLFEVPSSAFDPAPKVTSAVIKIQKNAQVVSREFKDFLRICFSQPRKTLINNLKNGYKEENFQQIFGELSLGAGLRPHQINTATFVEIYKKLKGNPHGEHRRRD